MPANTRASWLCLLILGLPVVASGQEFRIYTRLYAEPASTAGAAQGRGQPEIIARTLTLFHAGKVYDYLEGLGEMTILEPVREQFTIVNGARMLATTVRFSEIETVIHQSEQRALQVLKQPPAELSNATARLASIEFQLQPAFHEQYDSTSHKLMLRSRFVSYEVQGTTAIPSPEVLSTYLVYADWTARLNFVLHPQLLPGPRLALNSALREHELLPTEVRLHANVGNGVHRRAIHQFQAKLDAHDRRLIHHWDELLQSADLKYVDFSEFQGVLVAQGRKNRK